MSLPRSSSATIRACFSFGRNFFSCASSLTATLDTSYPLGMRLAYSAQAASAQAGSLALTATTWSLATGFRLFCFIFSYFLGNSFQLDILAAPDFLQVVEASHRRMHDVHHHIAQVDQDPFAARSALDAVDALAEPLELLPHVVGERFHLPGGIAARDHHPLEHRGQRRRVVDDDVVALDVLQRIDHRALLLAQIHHA